jgi:hypothetical protein
MLHLPRIGPKQWRKQDSGQEDAARIDQLRDRKSNAAKRWRWSVFLLVNHGAEINIQWMLTVVVVAWILSSLVFGVAVGRIVDRRDREEYPRKTATMEGSETTRSLPARV